MDVAVATASMMIEFEAKAEGLGFRSTTERNDVKTLEGALFTIQLTNRDGSSIEWISYVTITDSMQVFDLQGSYVGPAPNRLGIWKIIGPLNACTVFALNGPTSVKQMTSAEAFDHIMIESKRLFHAFQRSN